MTVKEFIKEANILWHDHLDTELSFEVYNKKEDKVYHATLSDIRIFSASAADDAIWTPQIMLTIGEELH